MSLDSTGHKTTSKRVTHLWRSFWSAMAYTGTDWKRRQPMENTSGSRVFSSRPNHLHQSMLVKACQGLQDQVHSATLQQYNPVNLDFDSLGFKLLSWVKLFTPKSCESLEIFSDMEWSGQELQALSTHFNPADKCTCTFSCKRPICTFHALSSEREAALIPTLTLALSFMSAF